MLRGILYELHLSVCTSLLRHLCVLLYTVLVFYDVFFRRRSKVNNARNKLYCNLRDLRHQLLYFLEHFYVQFGRLL